MLHSSLGYRGAFSAPHSAAALAGRDILAAGGTAIEAMVAAAATIAVTYPHMNGLGGDSFWLVKRPGEKPFGISACGQSAALATPEWYAERGFCAELPTRGGEAALTVPGTVGGWDLALSHVPAARRLPLKDLLGSAIMYATDGFAVTGNQADTTLSKLDGLKSVPGFADIYLDNGSAPERGRLFRQPALAQTLADLAQNGLRSFYEGSIAAQHGDFLEQHGSPLRTSDFRDFSAEQVVPLSLKTSLGTLYNMTPPTQGVASLMILGLFDRLGIGQGETFDHLHGVIEATKRAFLIRNRQLGDPQSMAEPAQSWLEADRLDKIVETIDRRYAMSWPHPPKDGDTIWMGAVDAEGTTVSFIQSVYWEFGSGLTCPDTGIFFQNRGAGFSLGDGPNRLAPGKRPFHTLNPALAELSDGRVMSYGTMGGEGQPQTQAALFTRYAQFGMGLQAAITAPRWLLGRTWGDVSTNLKLEDRFSPDLVSQLQEAGHDVELISPFSDLAGHAGAVVRHPTGLVEAATDPRADGAALCL